MYLFLASVILLVIVLFQKFFETRLGELFVHCYGYYFDKSLSNLSKTLENQNFFFYQTDWCDDYKSYPSYLYPNFELTNSGVFFWDFFNMWSTIMNDYKNLFKSLSYQPSILKPLSKNEWIIDLSNIKVINDSQTQDLDYQIDSVFVNIIKIIFFPFFLILFWLLYCFLYIVKYLGKITQIFAYFNAFVFFFNFLKNLEYFFAFFLLSFLYFVINIGLVYTYFIILILIKILVWANTKGVLNIFFDFIESVIAFLKNNLKWNTKKVSLKISDTRSFIDSMYYEKPIPYIICIVFINLIILFFFLSIYFIYFESSQIFYTFFNNWYTNIIHNHVASMRVFYMVDQEFNYYLDLAYNTLHTWKKLFF